MRAQGAARAVTALLALKCAAAFNVESVEPATVGLGGGVELTMIGQGFSGDEFMGANRVLIGGAECEVMSEFTEENRITCKRAPSADNDFLSAVPRGTLYILPESSEHRVDVNVDGRWMDRTVSLKYAVENTPVLAGMGHVSIAGGRMPFRGPLKSRFPVQFRVEIGDGVRCNTLALMEENNIEAFAEEPNEERHYFCQPQDNEPGFHNISIAIEPDLMDGSRTQPIDVTSVDGASTLNANSVGTAFPAQHALPDLFKMNATGDVYMAAHFPSVTHLRPITSAAGGGTLLTVTGSGFGTAPDALSVTVGGRECTVHDASESQIVCETAPAPASPTGACTCECPCECCKPGHTGLLHRQWHLKSDSRTPKDGDDTDAADADAADADADAAADSTDESLAAGDATTEGDSSMFATSAMMADIIKSYAPDAQKVWQEDLSEWDILQYGTHFHSSGTTLTSGQSTPRMAYTAQAHDIVNVLTGYFIPPYTGDYTFYVSGNDIVELYVEKSKVAASERAHNARAGRYYQSEPVVPAVSDPLPLRRGVPAFIEIRHADHTGDNFFHVGVSHAAAMASVGNATAAAYHTVPTMVSTNGSSFTVNGKSVSIPSVEDCSADIGGRVERALGAGAHVISEGKKEGSTCRYFLHVFRPQGSLDFRGDGLSVDLRGSDDWYYEPIPLSMLRAPIKTNADVVSVTANAMSATYNNTEGLCVTADAALAATVSVAALATYGEWLDIAVTAPANFVADVDTTRVYIGGVRCLAQGGEGGLRASPGLLQCRVPSLSAGRHEVSIHLGKYGKPAGTHTTEYSLTVASVLPMTRGSQHGGARITINGQGFAASAAGNNVAIGGAPCPVVEASQRRLVCATPPGTGAAPLVVRTNLHQGTATYEYDAAYTPAVARYTLASGDTLLPAAGMDVLTVEGTNFPSPAVSKVWLCKTGSLTDCKTCKTVNSTDLGGVQTISCETPALVASEYEIRVGAHGTGWSQPGAIVATNFVVTSFSPRSGGNNGGSIVTFVGKGFTKDTFVMVGPLTEVGLACNHVSVSDTQLVCQLERNTKQFRGALSVRVYANYEESFDDGIHAPCPDPCTFTMSLDVAAKVASYEPRDGGHNAAVIIRGTGLGGVTQVRAGGVECSVTAVTNTTVRCDMGSGPAGTYRLEVTDANGYADLADTERWQWYDFPVDVDAISPSAGSRGGSTVVTITGKGFHADGTASVLIGGDSHPCEVSSVTPTTIVCRTGAYDRAQTVDVNVTTNGFNGVKNAAYEFAAALSPWVDYDGVEPTTLPASGGTLTIKGQKFVLDGETAADVSVTIGDVPCAVVTADVSEITCRMEGPVPARDAYVYVHTPRGMSRVVESRSAKVSIPLSWSSSDHTRVASGMLGGRELTFRGTGFSANPADYSIKVCGLDCAVVDAAADRVVCLSPYLPTRDTRFAFPEVVKPETLPLRAYGPDGTDVQRLAKLIDGDYSTFEYHHSSMLTPLYLDAGADFAIDATHIEFFPATYERVLERHVGLAFFMGDSLAEGATWHMVYNQTTLPTVGWNSIALNDSVPVGRYIKVQLTVGAEWWPLGLAEIRVKGQRVLPAGAAAVIPANNTGAGNIVCPVTIGIKPATTYPQRDAVMVSVAEPARVTPRSGVEYEAARYKTPMVTAFNPPYGTAAGGTTLTISGSNLNPEGDFASATPVVAVDKVPCVVQSVTSSAIVCVTGERPKLPAAEEVGVEVRIPGKGHAGITVDDFLYADKWSSSLSWAGYAVPQAGDSVVLARGRNIILDESPPKLFFMVIDGALIFEDERDYTLDLNYMLIRGGKLQIGTPEVPFQHEVTITLHGNRSNIPLPVYGTKNIAVRGGSLLMYGKPKTPTWTRLAATAEQGASTITLRECVNWEVGDEIVIAPGSYDMYEAEKRELSSVECRADGTALLGFDYPLRFHHYGEIETHYGHAVDMAVEVGVLSRNIRIRGDEESWKQKFGAHMIFHSPDRPLVADIQYVELNRVGQSKIVGRYPIHFHVEGNRPGKARVIGCAVHHSFNRAIVLHATSHVLVKDNVGFDTLGHMFFVEDGVEKYNTFRHNLGIQAKPTGGQLAHDIFTSVFWMANPQNNFIDNAAAGSSHMGFWLSPPKHPRRGSFNEMECPADLPLGVVRGNTAHTNGRHGFWVHPDHYARQIECGPDDEASNPYVVSTVRDLVTWKNREQGMGLVDTGPYIVENVKAVDCDDAGIEVGDITGEQGAVVRDSVMIAHSKNNRPGEWASFRGVTGKRGLITPKSEGFRGERLTFIGFKEGYRADNGDRARHAGVYTCCRCWNDCSSEQGSYTYFFKDITWHDTDNRVDFGWPHNDIVVDQDGSFTGGAPNSTIIPALPHIRLPGCEVGDRAHYTKSGYKAWTGQRNLPPMVCPADYRFHRVSVMLPDPEEQISFNYDVQSAYGVHSQFMDESKNRDYANGWVFPVATATANGTSQPYRVFYHESLEFKELTVQVTEVPMNPFHGPLQLNFNYTDNHLLYDVLSRKQAGKRNRKIEDPTDPPVVYPMVFQQTNGSLVDFNDTEEDVSQHLEDKTSFSNMDQKSKILSVVFNSEGPQGETSFPGRSQFVRMTPIRCARLQGSDQCIEMLPPVVPEETWYWDEPEAWDEGVVPDVNASVVIRKGRTILLRGETAELRTLIVQGELRVDPAATQVTLNAVHIFIQSGVFEIGTPSAPYNGTAAINLLGTYGEASLAVSQEHDLGSGVLANFGKLDLHGEDVGPAWTKLAATARAGAREVQLRDAVPWRVGGRVVVPSTDYESDHFEYRTITGISADGRTLTLDEPLAHRHVAEVSDGLDLFGEVGYLSRGIVITNPRFATFGENQYGCHVMYGELSSDPQFSGHGNISNVEFAQCGQWGGDRPAFLLDRLTRNAVQLDRVAIWNSNSHAFRAHKLEGTAAVLLRDSVLWRSRQSLVQFEYDWSRSDKRELTVLEGNLLGANEHEGPGFTDELTCTVVSRHPITVRNNVIGGSWAEGFCIQGDACDADDGNTGNEVHSAAVGWFALSHGWCTEIKGLHAWKNSYLGVFSMCKCNMVVRDSVFHDNHISVFLTKSGYGRQSTTLKDSIVAGRSSSERGVSCANTQCVSIHGDPLFDRDAKCGDRRFNTQYTFEQASTGIVLGQTRKGVKLKNGVPLLRKSMFYPLPYDKLGSVGKYGVAYVDRVLFKNFQWDGPCGRDAVFQTMGEARSHNLPHMITEARYENVDPRALVYFHRSAPRWRTGVQCGDGWDCSGLETSILMSPDNTLFSEEWNAYKCLNSSYGELFVESLDEDALERTLYPLRVEYSDVAGKPFYFVNQPPDKFMESEWPKFKRDPFMWGLIESGHNVRIDFGDLAPRRSVWEYKHCMKRDKVLLSIHYQEPLRLQVWLDPNNNETGRAPQSESMVSLDMPHASNYYQDPLKDGDGDNTQRLIHVVMECGKGFEIHQLLVVRVAMRLDMPIDEFFDETSSEKFARNLATLLGVPPSRVRITEISAGSVVVKFEIEAEDAQEYDPVRQEEELNKLADRIGNITEVGDLTATVESIERASGTPASCANRTGATPEYLETYCPATDDGIQAWKIVTPVIVVVVSVAVVIAAIIVVQRKKSTTTPVKDVEAEDPKEEPELVPEVSAPPEESVPPPVPEEKPAEKEEPPVPSSSEDVNIPGAKDAEEEGEDDFPDFTPSQFNPNMATEHPPQDAYEPQVALPELRTRLRSMKMNLDETDG